MSSDIVVLSPRMNSEMCRGVPKDPRASDDLRISLVLRHCTKYWISQLHDDMWELCQRNARGSPASCQRGKRDSMASEVVYLLARLLCKLANISTC